MASMDPTTSRLVVWTGSGGRRLAEMAGLWDLFPYGVLGAPTAMDTPSGVRPFGRATAAVMMMRMRVTKMMTVMMMMLMMRVMIMMTMMMCV